MEAVGKLRLVSGWPLKLHLVGPSRTSALTRLNRSVEVWDRDHRWVVYHGRIPYMELSKIYQDADLGVFASSCENMPNILLETMASGLPLACSSYGPMPEVLGKGGRYFDPVDSQSIQATLKELIEDAELRQYLAWASYNRSKDFDWEICSEETFRFLRYCASRFQLKECVEF